MLCLFRRCFQSTIPLPFCCQSFQCFEPARRNASFENTPEGSLQFMSLAAFFLPTASHRSKRRVSIWRVGEIRFGRTPDLDFTTSQYGQCSSSIQMFSPNQGTKIPGRPCIKRQGYHQNVSTGRYDGL